METLNGFSGPKKHLITPHSALKIAILSIADSIFLTNLQKKGKSPEQFSLDIIKMQVR